MKVAVSACLWGELCRYDGATKVNLHVKQYLESCEVVLFCPEAPVLGTPRERISVHRTPTGVRVIGDESGRDVTSLLQEQTRALIAAHPDLDAIVLKSQSPSCGISTAPHCDQHNAVVAYGHGIAAAMLLEHFSDISIVDEHQIHALAIETDRPASQ